MSEDFKKMSYESFVKRCKRRLMELSELPDGWLEGGGKAMSKNNIEKLEEFIEDFSEIVELRNCGIFPNPNGYVQLEWSFPEWEVDIEFDFDGGVYRFNGTYVGTPLEEEDSQNFSLVLPTNSCRLLGIMKSLFIDLSEIGDNKKNKK